MTGRAYEDAERRGLGHAPGRARGHRRAAPRRTSRSDPLRSRLSSARPARIGCRPRRVAPRERANEHEAEEDDRCRADAASRCWPRPAAAATPSSSAHQQPAPGLAGRRQRLGARRRTCRPRRRASAPARSRSSSPTSRRRRSASTLESADEPGTGGPGTTPDDAADRAERHGDAARPTSTPVATACASRATRSRRRRSRSAPPRESAQNDDRPAVAARGSPAERRRAPPALATGRRSAGVRAVMHLTRATTARLQYLRAWKQYRRRAHARGSDRPRSARRAAADALAAGPEGLEP